jgi:hypothetical protein
MTQILGVIPFKGILKIKPFEYIRPLEDSEYQNFDIARTKLGQFAKKQALFMLVDANYIEYKNVVAYWSKIHCKNSNYDGAYLEEMLFHINRCVLNFLSSIFPFLDHSREHLSKEKPEMLPNFDKACNWCYDNYFSYRFLYKLRNYSQHFGMPITSLNTCSEIVNFEPFEVGYVLKLIALKDELIKYDKWKKIKNEVLSLPDQVDMSPHIDKMMYCIEIINATLYKNEEFIELLQHTAFLDKLLKETSIKEGTPCIFSQIQNMSNTDDTLLIKLHYPERYRITVERFPLNAMKLVDLFNLRSKGNPLELGNH